MRLITDDEVMLVSGGDYWDEAMQAISKFFGGGSSVTCQPGSTTSNGVTVTQTCGGMSSTVVISGPGYTISTTTTGTSASGSAGFKLFTGDAAVANGVMVTTTTVIGGKSSTTTNSTPTRP